MNRRHFMTVTASVVALAAAAMVVYQNFFDTAARPPVAADIELLRDETGLYFRPGLLHAAQPNITDSAYGLSLLQAAGRTPGLPDGTPTQEKVAGSVSLQSVWGPWFLTRIEQATGRAIDGSWAQTVVESLRHDGYFHDSSQSMPDVSADLATTTAALEVIETKGVTLSASQSESIAAWVGRTLDEAQNGYQACNGTRALQLLDRLDAATRDRVRARWIDDTSWRPQQLNSFENVLDLYGAACLMTALSTGDTTPVRETLRSALRRPVEDLQLLYHVAVAWQMVGGKPAELGMLAQVVTERLDASTGLVQGLVRPVGTLENSYYVTTIRRLSEMSTEDDELVHGVRTSLGEHGDRYGMNSMLLAAVVLRAGGAPDSSLEARAAAMAALDLAAPVTRERVTGWAMGHRLLGELGRAGPQSQAQPWPVITREDRGLAWVLLSQVSHLRGEAAPKEFAEIVEDVPGVLRSEAGQLSLIEWRAGVEILAEADRLDGLPAAELARELAARKGCPGVPELYRPTAAATECDLRATADALWLATYLNQESGGSA